MIWERYWKTNPKFFKKKLYILLGVICYLLFFEQINAHLLLVFILKYTAVLLYLMYFIVVKYPRMKKDILYILVRDKKELGMQYALYCYKRNTFFWFTLGVMPIFAIIDVVIFYILKHAVNE